MKSVAIKTEENKLESLKLGGGGCNLLGIKLDLLESLSLQNFAQNEELWITETCDWEVPVTCLYDILAIDGGNGGYVDIANNRLEAGRSGAYKYALAKLDKGQILSITIGAGGRGYSSYNAVVEGGKTTIEGIDFSFYNRHYLTGQTNHRGPNVHSTSGNGGGFGGGLRGNATWYGGGGGVWFPMLDSATKTFGNGYQGAVRFRWHNPEK